MFNDIINLICGLVATGGIGICLIILVADYRRRRGIMEVLLVTLTVLALIKAGQITTWAAIMVYDKYIESTIQTNHQPTRFI